MNVPTAPPPRPPQGDRPGWGLIALVLLGHAWLLGGANVLSDATLPTGSGPVPWNGVPPPTPQVGSDPADATLPVPVFLSEVRWIEAPAPSVSPVAADDPATPTRPAPRAPRPPKPEPPAPAAERPPSPEPMETTAMPDVSRPTTPGLEATASVLSTASLHAAPEGPVSSMPPVPAARSDETEAPASTDPVPSSAAGEVAAPTPAPFQTAGAASPAGVSSIERRHPVPAQAAPALLAPPAELRYDVTATRANGQTFHLQATLRWTHDGARYDARLSMGALLLGERVQHSRGQIHPGGLSPERFSDRRRSERATHFEPASGRIRFSSNTPDAPWQAGVQDRLSLFLQLGALLNAQPEAYPEGRALEITVAGTEDAEPWRFVVGAMMEEILPTGPVLARLLRREPRHPHDSRVELWLAPTLAHLPVRIRITQANGDVADQRLNRGP